jgi:uncharacterized protein
MMGPTITRREHYGLFQWDYQKAAANEQKHGIKFEDACEVFADRFLFIEDASVQGEERLGIIGLAPSVHPIHPLYVVAKDLGEDSWRMISARFATKQEKKQYEA